jgi:hypothetical protein
MTGCVGQESFASPKHLAFPKHLAGSRDTILFMRNRCAPNDWSSEPGETVGAPLP